MVDNGGARPQGPSCDVKGDFVDVGASNVKAIGIKESAGEVWPDFLGGAKKKEASSE